MIQRKHKVIALVASVIIGAPMALVALQAGLIFYDEHRVRLVCTQLAPGTSILDVRRIAAAAGLERFIPPATGRGAVGSYDENAKNWFFAIPVVAEMGDNRCAVYHDGHVIIKAEMESL